MITILDLFSKQFERYRRWSCRFAEGYCSAIGYESVRNVDKCWRTIIHHKAYQIHLDFDQSNSQELSTCYRRGKLLNPNRLVSLFENNMILYSSKNEFLSRCRDTSPRKTIFHRPMPVRRSSNFTNAESNAQVWTGYSSISFSDSRIHQTCTWNDQLCWWKYTQSIC